MRVNARLDPQSQQQLEYLLDATGAGISDVIKASIGHYYAHVRGTRPARLPRLREFIGRQGSGRSDVSSRTRELLTEALTEKIGAARTGRASRAR